MLRSAVSQLRGASCAPTRRAAGGAAAKICAPLAYTTIAAVRPQNGAFLQRLIPGLAGDLKRRLAPFAMWHSFPLQCSTPLRSSRSKPTAQRQCLPCCADFGDRVQAPVFASKRAMSSLPPHVRALLNSSGRSDSTLDWNRLGRCAGGCAAMLAGGPWDAGGALMTSSGGLGRWSCRCPRSRLR